MQEIARIPPHTYSGDIFWFIPLTYREALLEEYEEMTLALKRSHAADSRLPRGISNGGLGKVLPYFWMV